MTDGKQGGLKFQSIDLPRNRQLGLHCDQKR